MHPSSEVRSRVVALADGIASLALAAAKRASTKLGADLSEPLDLSLLGFPAFLVELLPDIISVLGRAALQSADAAQPLGTLATAFTDDDMATVCERLRTAGRDSQRKDFFDAKKKSKKAKLAWAPWHTEAGTAARVIEKIVQQIIVATMAGQHGLTTQLPALCTHMIAWGQVADWLALLSGEEGSAGKDAWTCASKSVQQLAFAKAPACRVIDVAEVVLKQANAESTPPLATFLLKRYEHIPELSTLLEKRTEWPATVTHVVEELAAGFPGVAAAVGRDEPMTPVNPHEAEAITPLH